MGDDDCLLVPFDGWHIAGLVRLVCPQNKAHSELIGGMFRHRRGSCIDSILHNEQYFGPVVLLVVTVDPECCFDMLVCLFRLAIWLGVIGSAQVLLDPQLCTQLLEECRSEARVPV